MYTELQEERLENFKFHANIHGVETGDNSSTSSNKESERTANIPKFGDPKDYEHLSMEERELLTAKMKKEHTNWVNNGITAVPPIRR